MRGSPSTMEVIQPKTAAAAVREYARVPNAVPLAGGTDFMVLWNMGNLNGKQILDLSLVREWSRISKASRGLKLGATVTHSQIIVNKDIQKNFPLLAQASATVGAEAIQNRGTIGGNIANASPAGDTFPPLSVYEAAINAAGAGGKRAVPISQMFAGVKKTTLAPGELIESVELPFLKARPSRQIFRKVGTRAAQALSKTVVAGLLWLKKDGSVQELRFAIGSVAPTVRRLKTAEAFVAGKRLSDEVIEEACALLRKDISPIDDIRSTADYRFQVSQNLLRGFLKGPVSK